MSDSESDDDSYFDNRDMKIEQLVNEGVSPGLKLSSGYDVPIFRDKQGDFESLENVI